MLVLPIKKKWFEMIVSGEKKEEYKRMCEEFKAQIADPEFEGYCHCMLYYKSLEKETE